MQRLYNGHLIALIIFFFMMLVHRKSLQMVIANIEVTGFDPSAFASPTYTFGIRSLFFCALTILVGYKTWHRLPLVGGILLVGGLLFFALGMLMMLQPRMLNILEGFPIWSAYIFGAIMLTVIAIFKYESAVSSSTYFDDDILDDLNE